IDTRNAETARAAFRAGAAIFNDVSGLTHDPVSLEVAAALGGAVCLCHAQGDPKTMQLSPRYRNVVIEVYEWLEARVEACRAAGIARERIIVDPGIGFGKTEEHNLALISALSAFHGLGCAVLLGASRKRFIGRLTGVGEAGARGAGSIGAALAGAAQGAQIFRVHDVAQTRQAFQVWSAASGFTGDMA
ncbi:MAG: dihydropteroate synthase, partial [Paracoccaceae bacterium]